MSEAWSWAVRRYGDKRLFASRDILGEEDEIQPNGKLFRKLGIKVIHLPCTFADYMLAWSLVENFLFVFPRAVLLCNFKLNSILDTT